MADWTTTNIPNTTIAELDRIGLEAVGGKKSIKPKPVKVIQMLIEEHKQRRAGV